MLPQYGTAASNGCQFIYKSLGWDTRNTAAGYKPWNIRKKSHAIQNNDINNKEKNSLQ